jgi:hypothetical protein
MFNKPLNKVTNMIIDVSRNLRAQLEAYPGMQWRAGAHSRTSWILGKIANNKDIVKVIVNISSLVQERCWSHADLFNKYDFLEGEDRAETIASYAKVTSYCWWSSILKYGVLLSWNQSSHPSLTLVSFLFHETLKAV